MKATIIIEKASDGFFSCYMEEDKFDFGLIGHGKTAEEAKADLLTAFEELKEIYAEEGKKVPVLEFEVKYDLQALFDYFNIINVTKLAEKAGINPSLLRQYKSGLAKASQKQYEKLRISIKEIGNELISAQF